MDSMNFFITRISITGGQTVALRLLVRPPEFVDIAHPATSKPVKPFPRNGSLLDSRPFITGPQLLDVNIVLTKTVQIYGY